MENVENHSDGKLKKYKWYPEYMGIEVPERYLSDLAYRYDSDGIDDDDDMDDDDGFESCCQFNTNENQSSSPVLYYIHLLFYTKTGRIMVLLAAIFLIYIIFLSFPTIILSNNNRRPMALSSSFVNNFDRARAHSLLVNLCNAYKARKVNGDLCNRLCFGDDWVILHLYEGNKVVITLKLSSQEVVLKSQHATIDEFEQLDPRVNEKDFINAILDIVNYNLRLGWPSYYKKHLMEIIWPMYARKNGFLSESDRRSLWTLVSQEEYITFRMLPLSRVTPKVIGTCGHFYQVEHLVPFRMKGYYMNLKAKILVHLMGMLKLFDEFLNEPLQWCDVKFDNLALAAEYPKRFMVMDADMLYTKSRLDSILTSRHCINDTDCSFFDCESRCNTTVGFCSRRLNNNVDVVCNKLVFQLFGKFWTKSNRYLAACHDRTISTEQRLADLRLAWSWNLPDV